MGLRGTFHVWECVFKKQNTTIRGTKQSLTQCSTSNTAQRQRCLACFQHPRWYVDLSFLLNGYWRHARWQARKLANSTTSSKPMRRFSFPKTWGALHFRHIVTDILDCIVNRTGRDRSTQCTPISYTLFPLCVCQGWSLCTTNACHIKWIQCPNTWCWIRIRMIQNVRTDSMCLGASGAHTEHP
jgi:hypothetical protein